MNNTLLPDPRHPLLSTAAPTPLTVGALVAQVSQHDAQVSQRSTIQNRGWQLHAACWCCSCCCIVPRFSQRMCLNQAPRCNVGPGCKKLCEHTVTEHGSQPGTGTDHGAKMSIIQVPVAVAQSKLSSAHSSTQQRQHKGVADVVL